MTSNMSKQPALLPMVEALQRLVPQLKKHADGTRSLMPDDILRALDDQGTEFLFVRLGAIDWEIESSRLSDEDIYPLLHLSDAGHEGEVWICTDDCFSRQLPPFKCDSSELAEFIRSYDLGMFFDGDVVILCPESRTLTIYHHSGGYTHVKFPLEV
jgi:hypothetical protein